MEYNPNKYNADYAASALTFQNSLPVQQELFRQSAALGEKQPPPFAPLKTEMVRPLVPKGTELVSVEELETLKENINDSFSETVNLYLELRRDIDEILSRLDIHNKRASHKI